MPILLTSGRHDEVTPALMADALARLPTATWHVFDNSAHMPHLEEPEHYLEGVDTFLRPPHPAVAPPVTSEAGPLS